MPDFTMCEGEGCPLKENCFRHKAVPSPQWQSWFVNVPYDPKNPKGCEVYWEMTWEKLEDA